MRKNDKRIVELDNILYSAGNKGRYQIIQGLFCTLSCLSCAFPALSIVFIGYVPEHYCAPLPNTTNYADFEIEPESIVDVKYHQCSIDIVTNTSGVVSLTELPCINGFRYNSHKDISIVSEWDLVCDRAGLAEMSQTLLMLGQGFGAFIFTSLSDRFGRKPIHLLCYGFMIVSSIGLAFTNNIGGFTALRFIIGASQQGLGLTAYAMFVELWTTDMRIYSGLVDGISWSLSVMALAPLAYFMQNYSWRHFQLSTLVSLWHAIFLYWMLDESLRWILANNKLTQAEITIRKICTLNKSDFTTTRRVFHEQLLQGELSIISDEGHLMLKEKVAEANGGPESLPIKTNGNAKESTTEDSIELQLFQGKPDRYTVLDVFRHFDVFKTTMILCFIWAVNSLTYYGLYLTSASMSGNRFLNYFLNAAVELPAMICVFLALRRFGRKVVCTVMLVLSGVSLIISVMFLAILGHVSGGAIASNVFSLLGKFAVSGSFMVIFIYTPEIFPTNLRNAGLGVASSFARIGGMLAPYSSTLSHYALWAPGVVFGSLCIMAAILMMYLPETMNKTLPTTIEEMKERQRKPRLGVMVVDHKML